MVHLRDSFTKEFDGDTGLVYMMQRWYFPETGTFVSHAPYPAIVEHEFTLAESEPVNHVDPKGEKRESKPGTDPEVQRALDEVLRACGGGVRLDDARQSACCQSIKELYQEIWGPLSIFEFLFGGPNVSAHQCSNSCACSDETDGTQLFNAFAKCMGKWQTTLNPFIPPGFLGPEE